MKIVQESLSPELKKIIYQGFSEHAIEQTGQDGIGEPLAFVALEKGNTIGAVVICPFWDSLHVKYLWVHKNYRRKGLGKALLNQAFIYGIKAKYPFAFVETMNFQALGFYQRMGFTLEHTRNGYSQNTSFHYLRKDLTSDIRCKKLSDINQKDMLDLMNHPQLRAHMPLLKGQFDEAQYHNFITTKEKIWEKQGFGPWAFTLNEVFIGWGGLQPVEDEFEIAIVLHPNYWGFGKAIYHKIVEQAFFKEKLKSVIVLLPPTRTRIKGILSLGFKPDGECIFSGERYLRYRLNAPQRSNYVIGVCGISGSGKTTLAHALSKQLNHTTTVFWDDFEEISEYPSDYVAWYKNSRDYSAWKTPALAELLKKLKSGDKIICPITQQSLKSTPFIIYDAPLGRNHIETGKYIDYLVFLDTPPDIALARRLKRDYFHQESTSLQAIKDELDSYIDSTRPLFLDTASLKSSADLVLDGNLPIPELIDQITSATAQFLKTLEGK